MDIDPGDLLLFARVVERHAGSLFGAALVGWRKQRLQRGFIEYRMWLGSEVAAYQGGARIGGQNAGGQGVSQAGRGGTGAAGAGIDLQNVHGVFSVLGSLLRWMNYSNPKTTAEDVKMDNIGSKMEQSRKLK